MIYTNSQLAPSSYVSGPNSFNKHMNLINNGQSIYTSNQSSNNYENQSQLQQDDQEDDDDDDEDVKFVNGKANYIIPQDDSEVGLIAVESSL